MLHNVIPKLQTKIPNTNSIGRPNRLAGYLSRCRLARNLVFGRINWVGPPR